jgi:arsenate reductase
MAEAFLRKHGGHRFDAYSCGLVATDIHPMTVQVMTEVGIDLLADGHTAQPVSTYLGKLPVAYLIIVCDAASKSCPSIWPGALSRLTWPFDDPPAVTGPEAERLEAFRRVRDEIELRIVSWLAELDEAAHPSGGSHSS